MRVKATDFRAQLSGVGRNPAVLLKEALPLLRKELFFLN
jgi:hypothetical protein